MGAARVMGPFRECKRCDSWDPSLEADDVEVCTYRGEIAPLSELDMCPKEEAQIFGASLMKHGGW